MSRDRIFYIAIIIIAALIIFYSLDSGESSDQYAKRIMEERAEKDLFFQTSEESPFTDTMKFSQLKYFPPNQEFIIKATVTENPSPQVYRLATSDGVTKQYKEFGVAEFELEGKINRLILFEMETPFQDKLFIPFADETSTKETYGAGRYLEVDKPDGNFILLDFNSAYNPYCAYSEAYSCPFPPRENLLEVSIRAGEKKYYEN